MITLERALTWLNVFDDGHMPASFQQDLISLSEITPLTGYYASTRAALLSAAQNAFDPLTYPELLLSLACMEDQNNQITAALEGFNEAFLWYQTNGQDHREGVSAWMCGLEGLQAGRYLYADGRFGQAVGKFLTLSKFAANLKRGDVARWYRDRVEEMRVEMVKTVHEPYHWLNKFEQDPLDPTTRAFVIRLHQAVADGKAATAGAFMELLSQMTREKPALLERPMVQVESGVAAFELGIDELAEELLRKAVSGFSPQTHRSASVRWMLGVVQFRLAWMRINAFGQWKESLRIFEWLKLKADQSNRQDEVVWYTHTISAMKKALVEMAEEYPV